VDRRQGRGRDTNVQRLGRNDSPCGKRVGALRAPKEAPKQGLDILPQGLSIQSDLGISESQPLPCLRSTFGPSPAWPFLETGPQFSGTDLSLHPPEL
jgi:hypothetical protein